MRFIYLLFILFVNYAFAATPITHIVLADQFIQQHQIALTEEELAEFYIGIIYPDIRYLGTVSREKTHEEGVTVEKILGAPSPFLMGKYFHSWVDEKRNEFVLDSRIYKILIDGYEVPPTHISAFVKVLEDEILFEHIDRERVKNAFQRILDDEISLETPIEIVEVWHQKMVEYFSRKPSETVAFLSKMPAAPFGIEIEILQIWRNRLEILSEDERFVHYTEDLIEWMLMNGR